MAAASRQQVGRADAVSGSMKVHGGADAGGGTDVDRAIDMGGAVEVDLTVPSGLQAVQSSSAAVQANAYMMLMRHPLP